MEANEGNEMRKPNQGMKISSNSSARSSDKIGTYSKDMGMPSLKIRSCLNKVNEHPQTGDYRGFTTPKTIKK